MLNIVAHAQSRGTFVAMVAAGAVLPFLARGRLRWLAILGLIAAALLSVRLFHEQFWNRVSTIQAYEEDGSAMGRIDAWTDAWNLALQNPLGYGGRAYDTDLANITTSTHNMYLECLVGYGFQGTLLWLAFIGVTWWECWRLSQRFYQPGRWPQSRWYIDTVAIMVGLIGMLAVAVFLNRMRWEMWWIFAAYVVCLKNIYISSQQSDESDGEISTIQMSR